MTVRELLNALLDHAEDGRALRDEVLIRLDGDTRRVSSSYSDGTFILIAGETVPQR